jgi:hypothetical protein
MGGFAEPTNLPGKLAAEIARVAKLQASYQQLRSLPGLHVNCGPVLELIERALAGAIAAAGSGDIAQMAAAVQDLEGFRS